MTTQRPHWKHQLACVEICAVLWLWITEMGEGMVLIAPTLLLADDEVITPDVVWLHQDRLETVLHDEDGWLHGAPDLVVEVLSRESLLQAEEHEHRLTQYEQQGVQEYWEVDRWERQITVYRLHHGMLDVVDTYADQDILVSSLLPGFACPVAALFR